jgi:CDP-glycerol glycerophosphotransferase (TagB/SpsB family)
MINDAIERGDLSKECVVVARPHPKYGIRGIHTKEPVGRYLLIDEPAKYLGESVETLEMEKSQMDHLANLLYHADVVVTGASTITIDAAVLDRPVINVVFDGRSTLPEHQSIRKNYYRFTHYIALVKTKGMRLVFSEAELIEWIKKYLDSPSLDREERKQVVRDFVGFTDSRSVERMVSALIDMFGV